MSSGHALHSLVLDLPASSDFERVLHQIAVDPGNEGLALDAVDYVIRALHGDTLEPAMRLMLASFLERRELEFAREELGARAMGRPGVHRAEEIAVFTFNFFVVDCGYDEQYALKQAYDAYFAAKGPDRKGGKVRTYSGDRRKAAERGKLQADRSQAENTMDTVIRPLLRRYGCAVSRRKPTGRPPRKSGTKVP